MIVTVKKIFNNAYKWDGNIQEAREYFEDAYVEVDYAGVLYFERYGCDGSYRVDSMHLGDVIIRNSYSDDVLHACEEGITYEIQ